MDFLFFSLAKHQHIYFSHLLKETSLQGRIVTVRDWPWPRPWVWMHISRRIDWKKLIKEKCQERQVKRKSHGRLFRFVLRMELQWIALSAYALLKREQPKVVVVWNGSHRYCQILLSLLPANTKTLFFENGLLPNTTTLDTKGVNYRNSVPRDADFYVNYQPLNCLPKQEQVSLVPHKARNKQIKPVLLPERYIFIPFQDDRDSQVRLFSPWVRNMRELFCYGEQLSKETGMTVIFKEHPSSRETYPEEHQRVSDKVLFANGNSTQELIESSQFIITVNSTVGLESILLAKPVITLGQAFFNIKGLVMHADSIQQLIELAVQFPEWPLSNKVRENFLAFMIEQYCVPGGWKNADACHLAEVSRRMLEASK